MKASEACERQLTYLMKVTNSLIDYGMPSGKRDKPKQKSPQTWEEGMIQYLKNEKAKSETSPLIDQKPANQQMSQFQPSVPKP